MRALLLGIQLFLLAAVPAVAGPGERGEIDAAAMQLSTYQSGTLPVERPVLAALATMERHGTPAEVSLLRDVQTHENRVLANLAERAIQAIRTRQRETQRRSFSATLPGDARLNAAVRQWRSKGLGPTEASCAAYAIAVLGDAALDPHQPDRNLTARELEDRGDIQAALRIHADQAASGQEAGTTALRAYGIDSERLILGLLHSRAAAEPEALETLVRGGESLTVRVLAERVKRPAGSDQATAADALGRMLLTELRRSPLPKADQELARRTLRKAAQRALPEVRVIVREALAQADTTADDRP